MTIITTQKNKCQKTVPMIYVNVQAAQTLGIHTLCPQNDEDWTLFPEIQALLQ